MFTRARITATLVSLLPAGRVWEIDPKSGLGRLFEGISISIESLLKASESIFSSITFKTGFGDLIEDSQLTRSICARWESILDLKENDAFTTLQRIQRIKFWLSHNDDSLNRETLESFLRIEGFHRFEIIDRFEVEGLYAGGNNKFKIKYPQMTEEQKKYFEKFIMRIKPAHVRVEFEYQVMPNV